MAETWLKCTECKSEIPYGGRHYVCSVSTCKRSKMRLVFCSAVCWDSHLSTVRHRDAWAEEAIAPTKDAWQRELAAAGSEDSPRPRAATPAQGVARSTPTVTARPASVMGSRPAQPSQPTEPIRNVPAAQLRPPVRAPETDDDDGRSAPRAPALTPDSSQAARLAPTTQPARPPTPPPSSAFVRPSTPAPAPAPAQPARRVVGEASPAVAAAMEGVTLASEYDRDVLIVISKMKKYIKDRSGMNCSDAIAEALSDHVRTLCDDAIRAAARDERKTVLERDVPRSRR